MLKDTINNYLQNPIWLSEHPIQITEQESLMFPWLADARLDFSFGQSGQLAEVGKLAEKDAAGNYYLQAIDLNGDQLIDVLVITDSNGNILEELFFHYKNNALSGETVATAIRNREQRIVEELLETLQQTTTRPNLLQLLELIYDFEMDPFTKKLNPRHHELLEFLFNFGIEELQTNQKIDFRKINFLLERLNNPWQEHEARTILQMVDDYKNFKTIKEAEIIFAKLNGLRNIDLIIRDGKYDSELIGMIRDYDMDESGMIRAMAETKKAMVKLGL